MHYLGRNESVAIRLTNERYEEIKETVVQMFVEYNVSCVPISAFEIASKMGMVVVPYSAYNEKTQELMLKQSEDGFLVEKNNGEFYIFYNDKKDYGRVNNTIMHEIGHAVLKHSQDSELAESEVKFFAKYALAPPVLIHKLKINDAETIADVFEISYEAAGYALGYYHKWLKYGGYKYTNYELKTIEIFKLAS